MDSLRVHTFFLDIRGIKKLKLEKVYDFIAEKLLLTEEDVAAIQPDLAESKVYVECHSKEIAEEIVQKFDGNQELVNNGEAHKIRLQMEDGGTDVKIYHLPPRMPNEDIVEYLGNFGEVLSIRNEKCKSRLFANTPNGVRMVRIRLQKQIPSFISVKGYSTYVTYQNQMQTCKHCGNGVHYGSSCAENRMNKAATGRALTSYADIASGSGVPKGSGHPVNKTKNHNLNHQENKRQAEHSDNDSDVEPAKKATTETQAAGCSQLQLPIETRQMNSSSNVHTQRLQAKASATVTIVDDENEAEKEKRSSSRARVNDHHPERRSSSRNNK